MINIDFVCQIFSLFWGSFQQYCSNLSTKAFLLPYVSYMVGKLLMWGLIICGLEDFLVISERLRILMTERDSNEGYISKCVISLFLPLKILYTVLRPLSTTKAWGPGLGVSRVTVVTCKHCIPSVLVMWSDHGL